MLPIPFGFGKSIVYSLLSFKQVFMCLESLLWLTCVIGVNHVGVR